MTKVCDHTSVAIIVRKDKHILFIERKQYNPGFALPAGHQDGLSAEETARKELAEEVGLVAGELKQKSRKTLPNPCKREGGTHHVWTIFEALRWHGEVRPNQNETTQAIWLDQTMIHDRARKLLQFMATNNLTFDNVPALVKATNENKGWWDNPGLEPPMYILLKELDIIS